MGELGDSISGEVHAAGYRVAVTHSPDNLKVKDWLAEHKAAGAGIPVSMSIIMPLASPNELIAD